VLGVVFMGWASDYSAIVVSVRNDGNSLSATAHRLIAPRTRQILLLFIFFYLLLVAGAFGNIVAGVLNDQQGRVPLGIIALAALGLVGGQMLYRMRTDLLIVTAICVGGTLLAVLLNADANGPVANLWKAFNGALNSIAPNGVTTVLDPTRGCAPPAGQSVCTPEQVAAAQNVPVTVSFVFWLLFLFGFCYLGAILPIWRYAQPVNYIGFWITALTIVFGGVGAFLAFFLKPEVSMFTLDGFFGFNGNPSFYASGAIQPLWPMLFVTIACGAISGWHALIGSVGTARQIESETDMLPVGGGAMFSEFALGLLSLMAIATASTKAGAAPTKFAEGVGGFLSVLGIPITYGTAIGFAAFVVIVITVVQLVFRVMRVTLAEGLGDRHPIWRNIHFGTLISMLATFFLVITGTWVYIWQLFGAANQLMASLSLLVVTVWLVSARRNATYALIPTLFMYITTMAATLVTAYNLFATVFMKQVGQPGHEIAVIGSLVTIAIALILFVAAIMIGIDGYKAYQRYRERPLEPVPATGAARA
jgi:carbon starvation protein